MTTPSNATEVSAEMHDFAVVLRQALLMIVRYLEKRYQLGSHRE